MILGNQVNRPDPTSVPVRSLSDAAKVMQSSWSENKDQALRYTPEFLQSCLDYPGPLPPLCPAFYVEDRLAAFVFGFPRTVIYGGRTLNLLLMTFFTVASDFKGVGLGRRIWAECAKQAHDTGYDGAIHYCVEGNHSNDVTCAGFRSAGFEPVRIFTIPYMMRFLKKQESEGATQSQACDTNAFLRASESASGRVPLSRKWSDREAEWQCRERSGAVASCTQDSAITGYNIDIADAASTTCTFVEDILWDGAHDGDRLRLLNQFMERCAQNSKLMVVPLLGYANMETFRAAGFRRSPRILHAYLTLWNGLSSSPVQSMYMDVL